MPTLRAHELLSSENTTLSELLEMLIELSNNKGYLVATKKIKIRNSKNAEEEIIKIEAYIELVRSQILNG